MEKSGNGSEVFYTYIYFDTRVYDDFEYLNETDYEAFYYEPIYVGKGKDKRYMAHLASSGNSLLVNKIRKIRKETGKDPEVLVSSFRTEKEAFAEEIRLIKLIGRLDLGTGPLCNATDGGDGISGNHTPKSKEFCEKISKIQLERIKNGTHQFIVNPPALGYKRTKEEKEKISKALTGRRQTPEHIKAVKDGMRAAREKKNLLRSK